VSSLSLCLSRHTSITVSIDVRDTCRPGGWKGTPHTVYELMTGLTAASCDLDVKFLRACRCSGDRRQTEDERIGMNEEKSDISRRNGI
jgi:hypothetical protein